MQQTQHSDVSNDVRIPSDEVRPHMQWGQTRKHNRALVKNSQTKFKNRKNPPIL